MPTAQSSSSATNTNSSSSKSKGGKQNHPTGEDNKIAKAVAKVNAAGTSSSASATTTSQENTRAATPDQQQQQQQSAASGGAQPGGGGGVKTPQEQPEFIKQSLAVIEKKVRNLEKRRTKLEEYRAIQAKGDQLNEDQLIAVSRFDEVIRTLELARELEKQFIGLANDALKQQKKQLKKEQMEREEAVREKLKESHKVLALLNTFGDEAVRNDFLNELNGASKLSEHEMNALDEFNKVVQPPSEINSRLEALSVESAEHIYNLIEGKNKQIAPLNAQLVGAAFTYADLKKLVDRILASSYWHQQRVEATASTTTTTTNAAPATAAAVDQEQHHDMAAADPAALEAQLGEQIGQMSLNVAESQQHHHHHQHHHSNDIHSNIPLEQGVYHQQNTSEDYILVSQSDCSENAQGKQQQGVAPASKTFFSTLNPQEPRNINEFLNRCENNDEGINFLQDSEIQHHPDEHNEAQHHHHQIQHHEGGDQQAHHHHQQQQQHYHQQGQSYQNYHDFDLNKESSRGGGPRPQRDYNGPRNNNYQQQSRPPRFQDDQRGPRRGGGQNGMGGGPRNGGGDKNGGGGYRGGQNRGPGGPSGGGGQGGNRGSGEGFRQGPRQGGGGAGGPSGQRPYPPRNQDNRQQVAQN